MGEPLRDHVRRGAVRALEGFAETLRPEIYAVSFRIWHEDQDPRFPYLAVGYNTESQARREGPLARWHYPYWLLDGFQRIGHVPEDPVGSALHLAEARAAGIWYADDLAGDLDEDLVEEYDDELVRRFDEVCLDAAWALHSGGHLARVLGRDVPVVVFDMDRPGWEVEATVAANPAELIGGFLEDHAGP
jgi:hypothetical protein